MEEDTNSPVTIETSDEKTLICNKDAVASKPVPKHVPQSMEEWIYLKKNNREEYYRQLIAQLVEGSDGVTRI